MGQEIERKFLLQADDWRQEVSRSQQIAQGYLNADPARTVRAASRAMRPLLPSKVKTKASRGRNLNMPSRWKTPGICSSCAPTCWIKPGTKSIAMALFGKLMNSMAITLALSLLKLNYPQ